MKNVTICTLIFILTLQCAFAQKDELHQKLSPYFYPPDSLKNNFGDYRSPLIFENGEKVKTPEQWTERRQEIKADWESYLGKWPELDKKQTFQYLDSVDKDSYTQYTVRFKWTPNEFTKGYLLVPKKVTSKMPAVVTVFYEAGATLGIGPRGEKLLPYRYTAIELAKRGFVTLALGTDEASARHEYSLYYPSIDSVSVQPLSMLGYAANAAYYALINRKDVDSKRVGIAGHSFGGKWAMFAACLTDNFAASVWSDPGIVMQEDRGSINYWEPWYLGFHPKPWRKRGLITEDNPAYGVYNQLRADNKNLHELHALMPPRPFLVLGGAEDPITRWKVLNHSVAVNELLGQKERVAMTNRPKHTLSEEAVDMMYTFFEYFLK